MARSQAEYVCQSCGAVYSKWQGKCDACAGWNSISEETRIAVLPGSGKKRRKGKPATLSNISDKSARLKRSSTGIAELDRVLGGGLVPGSAILVGGDPGIGKSTLLLDMAGRTDNTLYMSGEEAADQIAMRAERIGLGETELQIGTETRLENIIATIEDVRPAVVIIDSIQTVFAAGLESAPGTVAQVRACAHALITLAKASGMVLFLVGHVTKDGQIAGPRVLEHMVDTVLYFEGDTGQQFRILRAVKNRFGPTDEIGVFEMTGDGLKEVANPSSLFLGSRTEKSSGSAVFAGIEGSRPLLVEIQALVAPSMAANPRRTVVGWDSARLAMVLAVLDARLGLGLSGSDIYLNVAGGIRICEPAADLAVAAALISSATDKALPLETIVFGEISLSGDIRPVPRADLRLREALKLGFDAAILPASGKTKSSGMRLSEMHKLSDLLDSMNART